MSRVTRSQQKGETSAAFWPEGTGEVKDSEHRADALPRPAGESVIGAQNSTTATRSGPDFRLERPVWKKVASASAEGVSKPEWAASLVVDTRLVRLTQTEQDVTRQKKCGH